MSLAKSATEKPAILARLGEFAQRFLLGLRQAGVSVVAAFFAYIPTHLIGLQQSFWSAITAIAVAQMEFKATRALARKQFTGAAIGGAVGLGMILWFGDSLWVYASAIMLAVLICWLLNVGDAGQLGGITATVIMLVPHTGTPQSILISRLSEVGWGVCAGLGVAWATDLLVRRYAEARSHNAVMGGGFAEPATEPGPDPGQVQLPKA